MSMEAFLWIRAFAEKPSVGYRLEVFSVFAVMAHMARSKRSNETPFGGVYNK